MRFLRNGKYITTEDWSVVLSADDSEWHLKYISVDGVFEGYIPVRNLESIECTNDAEERAFNILGSIMPSWAV